jgi:hypothetical protein
MKLPINWIMCLVLTPAILTGCSNKPSCSSTDVSQQLNQIINDNTEKSLLNGDKALMADLFDHFYDSSFDSKAITAALSAMTTTVDSIRTVEQSASGTELSCEGVFKISVPAEVMKDVEFVQNTVSHYRPNILGGDVSANAKNYGMDRVDNNFSGPIRYIVQQSDDGKQTSVKIIQDDATRIIYMERLLARNALMKPRVDEKLKLSQLADEGQKLLNAFYANRAYSQQQVDCVIKQSDAYLNEHGLYTVENIAEWDKACAANPAISSNTPK